MTRTQHQRLLLHIAGFSVFGGCLGLLLSADEAIAWGACQHAYCNEVTGQCASNPGIDTYCVTVYLPGGRMTCRTDWCR